MATFPWRIAFDDGRWCVRRAEECDERKLKIMDASAKLSFYDMVYVLRPKLDFPVEWGDDWKTWLAHLAVAPDTPGSIGARDMCLRWLDSNLWWWGVGLPAILSHDETEPIWREIEPVPGLTDAVLAGSVAGMDLHKTLMYATENSCLDLRGIDFTGAIMPKALNRVNLSGVNLRQTIWNNVYIGNKCFLDSEIVDAYWSNIETRNQAFKKYKKRQRFQKEAFKELMYAHREFADELKQTDTTLAEKFVLDCEANKKKLYEFLKFAIQPKTRIKILSYEIIGDVLQIKFKRGKDIEMSAAERNECWLYGFDDTKWESPQLYETSTKHTRRLLRYLSK